MADQQRGWKAPAIFVQAAELPRGALVEYQVNMHTGREGHEPNPVAADDDDDDDEDESSLAPIYAQGDIAGAHWETCSSPASRHGARAALFLPRELHPPNPLLTPDSDGVPSLSAQSEVSSVLARAVSARVYHLPSMDPSQGMSLEKNQLTFLRTDRQDPRSTRTGVDRCPRSRGPGCAGTGVPACSGGVCGLDNACSINDLGSWYSGTGVITKDEDNKP